MKVFVYGTLRPEYGGHMAEFLLQHGKHVRQGTVKGLLIDIAWFPGVVKAGMDEAQDVVGDLFEIKSDEVLVHLDQYEGHPDLYERQQVDVYSLDGREKETAWVYFFQGKYSIDDKIDRADWITHIKQNGWVKRG